MKELLAPFSAWSGPRDAACVFVGEAWGREEDYAEAPFVGATGKEFWLMLGQAFPHTWPEEHARIVEQFPWGVAWVREREAWLHAAGVAFTNALNLRPPDNKIPALCVLKKEALAAHPGYDYPPLEGLGKYLHPRYLPQVQRLEEELAQCVPRLIVSMGNTACWALLRSTAIRSLRGTVTQDSAERKVLPTYHPANVFYRYKLRPIIVADLMKAAKEMQFAEIRRPSRRIQYDPTLREWEEWIDETLRAPPPLLSIDTETSLGLIDTISFARAPDDGIVAQFGPHRLKRGTNYITIWPKQESSSEKHSRWSPSDEVLFWRANQRLLSSSIPKLFQNGVYDLQYLFKAGMRVRNCAEDSMILHHAHFPEMEKNLGFIGSIWTSEPAWKMMHKRKNDSEKRDE